MSTFWHATYEVARKEVLQLIRTKRLLSMGIVFVLTLVLLTIFVPLVLFSDGDLSEGGENFVLTFFLSGIFFLSGYFYLQLLPILLTGDAVSSEWSHKTIFLLLSKPVPRTAMVLGKFLGSATTIAVTVVALMTLDYFVMMPLIPGSTSGEDIARFFGAMGLITLGVMAYAALSLMCSTMTRSTVAGILLAVTAWIIVLPLLASLDLFIALGRFGTRAFSMSESESGRGWSQYLSPGSSMREASNVLVPDEQLDLASLIGLNSDGNPVIACIALVAQTLVFLGIALLIVQRRNFE